MEEDAAATQHDDGGLGWCLQSLHFHQVVSLEHRHCLQTLSQPSIGFADLFFDLLGDAQGFGGLLGGIGLFLFDHLLVLLGFLLLLLQHNHKLLCVFGALLELRLEILEHDLHLSDLLVGLDELVKSFFESADRKHQLIGLFLEDDLEHLEQF